jgi:predicted TIM-barrel fold metal-dependent hydrolase
MPGKVERSWSGPLIDAHAHIGDSLFGIGQALDDLLASMAENDVVLSVVMPLKPRDYHLGPENDRIAAAVWAHPDRLRGFVRVDPWQGEDALRELRRGLDDLGLVGLYLHPFEEQFAANDEIVFPLMAELRERGLPLLLAGGYPGFSHPSQIGDLARQFPDVTIIATHGGQLNISGLLLADAGRMLRANPNVIMETSGIYREDFIEDTVAELGPERVVFGSNAPYMDQGFEAARVRLAHFDDAAKAAIGSENMQRILPSESGRLDLSEGSSVSPD